MNRRHFLAAIGAAALTRRPAAVGGTPTMADLLDRSHGPEFTVERGEEVWRALRQTGPLLCDRFVWSIDKQYEDCVHLCEACLFVVRPGCGHTITEVMGYTDEEIGARFGIPLACRTPVPAWAFRTS
jgi:hypothetical protein